MAENTEEGLKIKERHINEEHVVDYTALMPNLASLATKIFRHDFRASCDNTSTSWKFALACHELTKKNELSFSVTLIRDDSVPKMVSAKISVQICDSHDCPIYFPSDFQKDLMCPGEEMKVAVLRAVPLPLIGLVPIQEIVVNVTIRIRCHSFFG